MHCSQHFASEPQSKCLAGPTWSSTGSEASCAAVQEACCQLVESLRTAAKKVEDHSSAAAFWRAAVAAVHTQVGFAPASVQLSATGFFDGTARNAKGGIENNLDPSLSLLLCTR